MFQTKEKETSGKELSHMEMSNPSDKRVQNHGHKNAHQTQEKNGGIH